MRIYLDYNATTPVDPRVLDSMLPFFSEHFGNPASAQHAWGWTAEAATRKARAQVADLLGSSPGEIYFTSGATEANNWALFGVYFAHREEHPDRPFHLIISSIEHNSILNAARALEKLGAQLTVLDVNPSGMVEPDDLRRALTPDTKLISIITVNNEIGTINPMAELGRIAHEAKVYLHTDATQAVGKIPVDVLNWHVDLLSCSAHKFYGPKGVGALYVRARDPAVSIRPLFHGGGHEKGLRSGTLNVPGIVGFGMASHLAMTEMSEERGRVTSLRDRLIEGVLKGVPGSRLNGHPVERSPINISLTIPGRPVDQRVASLQTLGFSTGSACSAGRVSISHVLAGIGLSPEDAACTLRLSVGRWTTEADVEAAVETINKAFS